MQGIFNRLGVKQFVAKLTAKLRRLLALKAPAEERSVPDYASWIERYDTLTPSERLKIKNAVLRMKEGPKFSVLMVLEEADQALLKRSIRSVQEQLYGRFVLCIICSAAIDSAVQALVGGLAAEDKRIKFKLYKESAGIAVLKNRALNMAQGDFFIWLDPHAELSAQALFLVAKEIERFPEAALVYSDEDKIDSAGRRSDPYFKPDFDAELLLSHDYLSRLGAYRISLVRALGGFRAALEGAEDWDLALRIADHVKPAQIRHLPRVLYHRPVNQKASLLKSAALQAVEESLLRNGCRGAGVEFLQPLFQVRVTPPLPKRPSLVSIIIPTKDRLDLLKRCLESIIAKTTYPEYELLIVDHDSREPATRKYLAELEREGRIKVLPLTGAFNFSRFNNQAQREARGEILAFLNNDLEVITPGWLSDMVSFAVRPKVGAVGAKLLYPDNTIQHAGVILGLNGIADHALRHKPAGYPGYFGRALVPSRYSAVTGACLVVRRKVFQEVHGFDEEHLGVAFNDIDFCLKLMQKGYHNLAVPSAELFHYESSSRGYERSEEQRRRLCAESKVMEERWGELLQNDPYYNPNLSLNGEDFCPAFPPRVGRSQSNERL